MGATMSWVNDQHKPPQHRELQLDCEIAKLNAGLCDHGDARRAGR